MSRWILLSQTRGRFFSKREVTELEVEGTTCTITGIYGDRRQYQFRDDDTAYRFARDIVFQAVAIEKKTLLESPKPIMEEFIPRG